MKYLLYLALGFCFSGPVFAETVELEFSTVSSFFDDFEVKSVDEARLQVSAFSEGVHPSCYKSYERNFPHAPQVESFSASKNILVTTSGRTIQFSTLKKELEEIESSVVEHLQQVTDKDCQVILAGLVLIEGQVVDGFEFNSNFPLVINSASEVLAKTTPAGASKNVSSAVTHESLPLLATNLFGDNWDRVWLSADPESSEIVKNY